MKPTLYTVYALSFVVFALGGEWLTPPWLLEAIGPFDLDPCAPIHCPWKIATTQYSTIEDGLLQPWKGRVFCNPPYGSQTGKWLSRCAKHRNATALVFARTETADWKDHIWRSAHAVLFLYGRLHFHHVDGTRAKANAGGPSALVSYDLANTEVLRNAVRQGLIGGRLVVLKRE